MALVQLIYISRPFGFDDLALAGILAKARMNNERDGITGSLICREDIYMQLLEGERNVVEGAYARIAHDDRHTDVTLIVNEPAAARLFPDWAMRHDPARSWMWSRQDVAAGRHLEATPSEARGIFRRLSGEAAPSACPHSRPPQDTP